MLKKKVNTTLRLPSLYQRRSSTTAQHDTMESTTDTRTGQCVRVAADSNSTRRKRPVGKCPAAVAETRVHRHNARPQRACARVVRSASGTSGSRERTLRQRLTWCRRRRISFSLQHPRHAPISGLIAHARKESLPRACVRLYCSRIHGSRTTLCIHNDGCAAEPEVETANGWKRSHAIKKKNLHVYTRGTTTSNLSRGVLYIVRKHSKLGDFLASRRTQLAEKTQSMCRSLSCVAFSKIRQEQKRCRPPCHRASVCESRTTVNNTSFSNATRT